MTPPIPALHAGKTYPGRILAVDDDPLMREFASLELGLEGCTVTVASDGLDALAKLRAETAEVMILDLDMPRLDGFGVLRALSEIGGPAPPSVIVLTSRTDAKALSQAFDLGAVAYALKPVDWDQLRLKIHKAYEARR